MSGCLPCISSKKEDYFLPPPNFAKCENEKKDTCPLLPLDTIIRGMSQGTVMFKVNGPTNWNRRKYKVDVQNLRFSYTPSHKPFWKNRNTKVDISDIKEIRTGWHSDVFYGVNSKFNKSKWRSKVHPHMKTLLKEINCFSIVVGPSRDVIDLIAPNMHTRDAWIRGLNHLLATCKSSQKTTEHNRWLREQVRKADINNNGSLNFNECLVLLRQLNISMERSAVKQLFDKANFKKSKIDGEDALDPEEFVRFYRSLTKRPDLETLMKKYSVSKTPILDAEELQQFFIKGQKDLNITIEECKQMIEKYEPQNAEEAIAGYMTVVGFRKMLLSVEHNIFNKKHRIIYQDMTHPLNHYYIASSHNTYLVADQLIGASSVEGYIQALLRGCRCLELDIWDGPDGEPIIYHGYTLTSRIFLKDVLQSIKEYAFRVSQYPVILSLENHCSSEFQIKMAEYFDAILGEYLYKEPIGDDEFEYPSPETFARKILLKGKKLKDDETLNSPEFDDEDQEELLEELEQHSVPNAVPEETDSKDGNAPLQGPMKANYHLEKSLSDLINYCAAKKFKSFEDCKNWQFYEMASFEEKKALKFAADEGEIFIDFNKKHLSRIYPRGTRTDSSNYDPVPYWNVGCQLVALNYQTKMDFTFLNEAKFAQNGRCGYVLKPRFLCDNKVNYTPKAPDPSHKRHMLIRIISGQQLPKPNCATEGEVVDPYVVIKVLGHPVDVQKKKTHYISNNGFDPVWDTMFLLNLHLPELAMVLFLVKDHNLTGKNKLLGKYAIPYTSIVEGYRHIQLCDAKGDQLISASLFVHVTTGED